MKFLCERSAKNLLGYLTLGTFIVLISICGVRGDEDLESSYIEDDGRQVQRYQIARFNYQYVGAIYPIVLWVLLGSLAKLGFHLFPKFTKYFPESCQLLILGLAVGGMLYGSGFVDQNDYKLNSNTFFLLLLPPIILEAGYFMPSRPFLNNVGTVVLFAVVNTAFNTLSIGVTLWAFNYTPLYGGTYFGLLDCLVYAALLSSIDPVAVLATFVEIQVNDMLYIIVFGESLLNDGAAVVLYRLFDSLANIGPQEIITQDILFGCISFVVVIVGGVGIGIIFGLMASMTTKYTARAPILEPLILIAFAYLAYLTAEMVSTSGILAITFCGMFMKQYVPLNIEKKSTITIEYVLKMIACIMETIIFLFMGLSTVSDQHVWNTGFIIITIVLCTVYRFIGCFVFGYLSNTGRLLQLQISDMIIMSYGGIRGAVAFALALILNEDHIPRKREFVTGTMAVVFFTMFIQGTTIGPIVKLLKIKRQEAVEPTMNATVAKRVVDNLMSGLENISGMKGKNSLLHKMRNFDRRFIKPVLLRDKEISLDEKLLYNFKKIHQRRMSKMASDPSFMVKADDQSERRSQMNKSIVTRDSESVSVIIPRNLRGRKNRKNKNTYMYRDILDDAIEQNERQITEHFEQEQLNNDSEPEIIGESNPVADLNDQMPSEAYMSKRRSTIGHTGDRKKSVQSERRASMVDTSMSALEKFAMADEIDKLEAKWRSSQLDNRAASGNDQNGDLPVFSLGTITNVDEITPDINTDAPVSKQKTSSSEILDPTKLDLENDFFSTQL